LHSFIPLNPEEEEERRKKKSVPDTSDIKTISRDFLDTKIDSIDSNELNRTSEEEEEEEEERIALVHSSES